MKAPESPNFLVSQFLENVRLLPENRALYINGAYYTFKQFGKIVAEIYHKIPKNKSYQRIGIYTNDDVYTYASLLAINLYGAAYVPLNNRFPFAKNKVIVEQSGLDVILSSVENQDIKKISDDADIVHTFFELSELKAFADLNDCKQIVDQPISYVLFTSGSTGEPKGVEVADESLKTLFQYFDNHFNFNASDKFLQASELTFDFSVFSFFMPLHRGACCYVVPDIGIKFVKIIQMLKEFEITVFSIVPTILKYIEKYLQEIELPKLRYSFFSGDVLYHDLAMKWAKVAMQGKVLNCYGTTESAVICTQYVFDITNSEKESVNGIVSIGKPFESMEIRIVDDNNNEVEKGDLSLSGKQVIQSYLNGVDRNRFYDCNGKTYYKPGDIVSFNSKGNLNFHGRKDTQVKINGFRVELQEIEFAIEKITKSKCVVFSITDENSLNVLFACIEGESVNENELKTKLSLTLPDFMIPQKYSVVDKFELSLNGKIDRSKLLEFQKLKQ